MYHVSFSSHNHRRHTSIIPASHILQTVHLIPNFGQTVDLMWSSDTVLNKAPSFYLNPYL
jgi:hypothetical protein